MKGMLRAFLCSIILLGSSATESEISLGQDELTVTLYDTAGADLDIQILEGNCIFTYRSEYNLTEVQIFDLQNNSLLHESNQYQLNVTGKTLGHETILFSLHNCSPGSTLLKETYLHVNIEHSKEWKIFSDVIGWIYFVAWSISFYPQIYENWKRKSVVGLNFDFLALNLFGFVMYSTFNAGLLWNSVVQKTYFEDHPGGLIPVMVNDVVFAFHAVFAIVITIIQCFIYERIDQAVSLIAKILMGIFFLFVVACLISAGFGALSWLDFLTYCSYVKLAITIIKYVPQAWMNFRRKSTLGWSIGNIFLDFTGGILSMLQMIVNSWNYDDWKSIFGDPTKFGLGLFSVIFDIFFLVQHYILYRHSYEDFPASVVNSRSELVT